MTWPHSALPCSRPLGDPDLCSGYMQSAPCQGDQGLSGTPQACEILVRTQSPELSQCVGKLVHENVCQEAALKLVTSCLMRILGFLQQSSIPEVSYPRMQWTALPTPSDQAVQIPPALPMLCIGLTGFQVHLFIINCFQR